MSNIFIVDIESVETRYTGQWKTHLPSLLTKQGHAATVIDGPTDIPQATTPGAFLNFGGTNVYKAAQVEKIGRLFCDGRISAGDHFIFTDAWHPGIINLKYMSELLGIPVKIHALWHAGSYDPADFLGRLIGDAPWVRNAEKSFYNAIDHNYFATEFHIDIFCKNLLERETYSVKYFDKNKIIRTGWPMEYLPSTLDTYKGRDKSNLIVFPHRIAPEKQVDIFRDLENLLPQYDFIVCQDSALTKKQYHEILSKAKIVFSCSLQETLGIGCYEGALVDAIPMVPNRLSYKEMYYEGFKYPSEWTESWKSYQTHKQQLYYEIIRFMDNYETYKHYVKKQAQDLTNMFFSCDNLLKNLQ